MPRDVVTAFGCLLHGLRKSARYSGRNTVQLVSTMAQSRLALVPAHVERTILLLRGERVILDADLATLYRVETRSLVQAVKRNLQRFPGDFVFQLTADEAAHLRSQTGISTAAHGGRRYAPYAFTEHGVAMLAAVLKQPTRNPGEHRNCSRVRATARNAGRERRTRAQADSP
jgi:hypothetical protein